MQWFDTKTIKDEDKLTPEQIAYIKKPSLTIFGPFNVIARHLWGILLAFIGFGIGDQVIPAMDESGWLSLIFVGVYIWFFYFITMHHRKWAWNANRWDNFDDFRKSEEKWQPWGIIFFVITVLVFVASVMSGVISGVLETLKGAIPTSDYP